MSQFPESPREATNPVFNDNKLKLGVFGINGAGTVMTRHADRFFPTWKASLAVAQIADRAGLEAIVPYSRWKPFGNARHISGTTLDTFTWAAGVSAQTTRSGVFSTCHAPTMHPLVVAKQGATIDHISGGRFTLNVVVGWFVPEMETFGVDAAAHDERYEQADEWVSALKRLWVESDEVDVDGRFVKIRGGVSQPKPLQKPLPPIMNAGSSERGRHFAAKHADIAYVVILDTSPAAVKAQVHSYKQLARETYGRELQVWAYALVIQRPSVAEAEATLANYSVEWADNDAIDVFVHYQIKNAKDMPPEAVRKLRIAVAGGGGLPLFGTAQNIADRLKMLSECGIDGVLLTFVDYHAGLQKFTETVLPLVEQAGLRHKVRAP